MLCCVFAFSFKNIRAGIGYLVLDVRNRTNLFVIVPSLLLVALVNVTEQHVSAFLAVSEETKKKRNNKYTVMYDAIIII